MASLPDPKDNLPSRKEGVGLSDVDFLGNGGILYEKLPQEIVDDIYGNVFDSCITIKWPPSDEAGPCVDLALLHVSRTVHEDSKKILSLKTVLNYVIERTPNCRNELQQWKSLVSEIPGDLFRNVEVELQSKFLEYDYGCKTMEIYETIVKRHHGKILDTFLIHFTVPSLNMASFQWRPFFKSLKLLVGCARVEVRFHFKLHHRIEGKVVPLRSSLADQLDKFIAQVQEIMKPSLVDPSLGPCTTRNIVDSKGFNCGRSMEFRPGQFGGGLAQDGAVEVDR